MNLLSHPRRQFRRLRRFVVGRNLLEGVAAALVGLYAGSVALIGFALLSGFDGIRVLAAGRETRGGDSLTTRLLGVGALAGGGYVLLRSTYTVLAKARPAPTLLGEGIVELSIMVTVVGSWAACRLLPRSHFDARAALRTASARLLLAGAVLTGLVLNATLGLWKADPLSALPVAGFFFFTGERLLRERAEDGGCTPLPEAGELLASIVTHVGAEHTERPSVRIIVCGGGSLGLLTARALGEAGHDVTIIEEDPERCRALEEAGTVVRGNAARPEVLRRAGVERCDVVAALSGSAETNYRICRAAEREAPVCTVMHAPFGAEKPIETDEKKGIRTLGRLDDDHRILELRVASYAPIAGERLSEVQLPRGGRVLSTAGGKGVNEETVFTVGECYVVVAGEKATSAMIHTFRGQHSSTPFV